MTTSNTLPTAYSYVRFSSVGQKHGTSVERQVAMGKEWAEANNYEYSSETFEDLGVSGFTGAQLEDGGALARFINAVEDGMIQKNSVLLIERFDRFSRTNHWEAADLLRKVIKAGVNVVTTYNGKLYDHEALNSMSGTIEIILGFQSAHEFSKNLSDRVGKAWKINATKVRDGTRKRTTRVPSWIKVVGTSLETNTFELIDSKAKVVREILGLYADGEPTTGIARGLRDRGVPTMSGRGTWTGPLVHALVKEVTPYGTLLVGEGTKKNRKIVDEVKDYYPRIVDQDTQRRVFMRLQAGNTGAGGSIKGSPKNKTKGRLVGVLRSNDGNLVRVKRNNRSIGYYDYITNRYIATVGMVDDILVDQWNEVVEALGVETTPEIAAMEAELIDPIVEMLEDTLRKREDKPSAAMDRIVLSLKADLEQAQEEIRLERVKARFDSAVPDEIAMLDVADANVWVRRIVKSASVTKRGKGKAAKVMVSLELKNGVRVDLGDTSGEMQGFTAVNDEVSSRS